MIAFPEDEWNEPFVVDANIVQALNFRHQKDKNGDVRVNVEFILGSGYSKVWKWQLLSEANKKLADMFRGEVPKMFFPAEEYCSPLTPSDPSKKSYMNWTWNR
jgi:hypothetical protein